MGGNRLVFEYQICVSIRLISITYLYQLYIINLLIQSHRNISKEKKNVNDQITLRQDFCYYYNHSRLLLSFKDNNGKKIILHNTTWVMSF